MNKRLGLDWWDVALQVLITFCLAVAAAEAEPMEADVNIPVIVALSAVVLAVRRRLALRRIPPEVTTTGEVQAIQLEDLEQRVAELENVAGRVAELEERMDFSERLLVQGRQEAGAESPSPARDSRLAARD
jgi:hypothetical protein